MKRFASRAFLLTAYPSQGARDASSMCIRAVVPPAQPVIRAHHRDDQDETGLRGMVARLWRCQDDDSAAGSAHVTRPHSRNGQRGARFLRSSSTAKKRIKAREQFRMLAAAEGKG